MANKADRMYFENFVESADHACRASAFLLECMKNYNPEDIEENISKMHEIEHSADNIKHKMSKALAKAFVTPVDREDLALLSDNIDNVTDCVEEVLQRFYVDGIRTVLPEAIGFAEKIVECCDLMKAMLAEFPSFKKPAKLHELVIELNNIEEECDVLYMQAVLAVRRHCTDVLDILFWREIYDCMEKCADACEHVGDCVETVVMKNT